MEEKAKRGEKWAKRNGRSPYDCMDTEDIAALPVADVCDKHCILLLWATWPKLADAMTVMKAWGFTYKTGLPWLKMTQAAAPRVGLGYHARSCSELLLIGMKGSVPVPEPSDRPVGVIFCPIHEHSQKPDYQYDIAEGYPGPYLEMFHRPRGGIFEGRPDWVFLGNEVDGLDIRDALVNLRERQLMEAPIPDRLETSVAAVNTQQRLI